MVRLWVKDRVHWLEINADPNTKEAKFCAVVSWQSNDRYDRYPDVGRDAATPEAALAAAILAAVDRAPQLDPTVKRGDIGKEVWDVGDAPQEYRIDHVTDLLQLTDRQVEAFAQELPVIVAVMRVIGALAGDSKGEVGMLPYVTWIDDGKRTIGVSVKAKEGANDPA